MLSLVHLIYMAGDKCMRQNACFKFILPELCFLYNMIFYGFLKTLSLLCLLPANVGEVVAI